jgi:hypothetical protein
MTERTHTATTWGRAVSAAWRRSVQAIFETGDLLINAKKQLPHGAFQKMIQEDLPFGQDTAQRLMLIAKDTRLRKPAHGRLLPPSWRTLFELSRLPDATLVTALKDGTVNPEMTRSDVPRHIPVVSHLEQETAPRVVSFVSQHEPEAPPRFVSVEVKEETREMREAEASDSFQRTRDRLTLMALNRMVEVVADYATPDDVARLLALENRDTLIAKLDSVRQFLALVEEAARIQSDVVSEVPPEMPTPGPVAPFKKSLH